MSKEAAMAVATGQPIPTTPTTTPTPENPNSTAFSHLAKKEAEIVKLREGVKKEQEIIALERKKLSAVNDKYQEFLQTKEKDPVAAMKLIGFSETDIFNYMAQQQPEELTPEQKAVKAATEAADAKIKEFEEAQKKKELESLERRDQGLIQNFRSEITQAIQAARDKYEYCAHYGPIAEELAYETVIEVLKQSGGKELLSVQDALQEVESYYEEQDQLMSGLKKRQPKAAPVPTQKTPERTRTPAQTPSSAPERHPISRSRTLNNSTTATVASTRPITNESREAKKARLIEALKNGGL